MRGRSESPRKSVSQLVAQRCVARLGIDQPQHRQREVGVAEVAVAFAPSQVGEAGAAPSLGPEGVRLRRNQPRNAVLHGGRRRALGRRGSSACHKRASHQKRAERTSVERALRWKSSNGDARHHGPRRRAPARVASRLPVAARRAPANRPWQERSAGDQRADSHQPIHFVPNHRHSLTRHACAEDEACVETSCS